MQRSGFVVQKTGFTLVPMQQPRPLVAVMEVPSYAGDWVTRLIRRRGEPAIL